MNDSKAKVCLTIAGLDPSGGAGIIADIKTFSAFGCFAAAAVTSITFQNTMGVFGASNQTAKTIEAQIEPIINDYIVDAAKTGMLPTIEIIEETARLIRKHGLKNIVVDPVVRSTSGFDLIDNAALQALINSMFPLSDLITPNIPEAERISGISIETEDDIKDAVGIMRTMGARNVLIKGGHLPNLEFGRDEEKKARKARDFLFIGNEIHIFEDDFIDSTATHGTGCTLSSAIAANLALGKSMVEAVRLSKTFVTNAIRTAPHLGRGNSPINI